MAIWKCKNCGTTKESRCKPKKCPNCGEANTMEKEGGPDETAEKCGKGSRCKKKA